MLTFSINQDINDVVRKGGIADARPTTDAGFVWWSEAWIKTLEERTHDTINLDAYGYVCELNTTKKNARREMALLEPEEVEAGVRGVANTVAYYVDTSIDDLIDNSEVATFIEQFKVLYDEIFVEEGQNLWVLLNQARQFFTPSVTRLRALVEQYDMGEVIEGVLTNPECLQALEEEFSVNIFNQPKHHFG